jgi:hypothetical protein
MKNLFYSSHKRPNRHNNQGKTMVEHCLAVTANYHLQQTSGYPPSTHLKFLCNLHKFQRKLTIFINLFKETKL